MISIITSLYKGEKYIDTFFHNLLQQSAFPDCELLIIHVLPSRGEEEKINPWIQQLGEKIQYIKIAHEEPLSGSWNRGIIEAKGDFISLWNIDDRRTEESLQQQLTTLQSNKLVNLTYGDFIEINRDGQIQGEMFRTPEFDRNKFTQGSLLTGGSFLLFTRQTFNKFGLFDEQLRSAADLEYVTRIILAGAILKRTPGLMGYFLNEKQGLSTMNRGKLSMVEQNVVHLRYGNYDRVKYGYYLKEAYKYDFSHVLSIGKSSPIYNLLPDLKQRLSRRKYLWILGFIKNLGRIALTALGLWEISIHFRNRISKRTIPSG